MSDEFVRLQTLINQKKAEMRLIKAPYSRDTFGLWLSWWCKAKPCAFNFFGASYILYKVLLNEWLWIIASIIVGALVNWFFLLCILVPFIVKSLLPQMAQGFIYYDAFNNEALFDSLWQHLAIGILSTRKHETASIPSGVPDIMIMRDFNTKDWKEAFNKVSF